MNKRAVLGVLVAAMIVLLAGSWTLWLYHSRVARPMEEAGAAFSRGEWKQAGVGYERVLAQILASPWMRRVLEGDSFDALIGDIETLYALGKYDEALAALGREADRSPEFARDPRRLLWSGNLWFRKAISQEKDTERREQLNAAVDFYRKGLEQSPESWDLKFNYELVSLILAQENPLRREKREKDQKKRILPRIRTDQERQRRVLPPEERG